MLRDSRKKDVENSFKTYLHYKYNGNREQSQSNESEKNQNKETKNGACKMLGNFKIFLFSGGDGQQDPVHLWSAGTGEGRSDRWWGHPGTSMVTLTISSNRRSRQGC